MTMWPTRQTTKQLEICAETLQACAAASAGGADRIELCSALSEGGVTPSAGLLQVALATASIPVHVLVRPRAGNFVYTGAEHRSMCLDVEAALSLGAHGVVVGALLPNGEIDRDRTAELVRLASGRPVTFHRVFDQTPDLEAALETVIDLGCDRVLTSGGRPNVTQGLPMLQKLTRQAGGRIRIAAGGGVTLANAAELAAVSGLDVHASLRAKQAAAVGDPLWNEDGGPTHLDAEAVRALSAIVLRAS